MIFSPMKLYAECKSGRFPLLRPVDYINRGCWFGKKYAIGLGAGYSTLFRIVEADHEQAAIEELADDPEHRHLIASEDPCECEDVDQCECDWGPNGERLDLSDLRVLEPCEIAWEGMTFRGQAPVHKNNAHSYNWRGFQRGFPPLMDPNRYLKMSLCLD